MIIRAATNGLAQKEEKIYSEMYDGLLIDTGR